MDFGISNEAFRASSGIWQTHTIQSELIHIVTIRLQLFIQGLHPLSDCDSITHYRQQRAVPDSITTHSPGIPQDFIHPVEPHIVTIATIQGEPGNHLGLPDFSGYCNTHCRPFNGYRSIPDLKSYIGSRG